MSECTNMFMYNLLWLYEWEMFFSYLVSALPEICLRILRLPNLFINFLIPTYQYVNGGKIFMNLIYINAPPWLPRQLGC